MAVNDEDKCFDTQGDRLSEVLRRAGRSLNDGRKDER